MLSIGDVVRHRILGNEKVIVGIGQDRYLCVYREDVEENGNLRSNARVAMHRQENLHKIGRIGIVSSVSLDQLYGKEFKQTRHLRRRNLFIEEIVPYTLFAVAMVFITMALFSGVETVRSHFEPFFFKKVEERKSALIREAERMHREGMPRREIKRSLKEKALNP